ncbi:hypothetical protein D0T50_09445 [Bacteroides sp. 214]|uniref:SUMF1/EgtB/PvdO family nonheme iron enzyme n=1 Tax=Bacteroides sp. 214 TaxID=2302935 RepID=UPI0013D6511D|nr:SUMF1/EgtB/PvdO family nonheme iron enzyme [Bacteroides sp. 214]NDW13116.1 hypothetical protein [Bacteroides sp. 214]
MKPPHNKWPFTRLAACIFAALLLVSCTKRDLDNPEQVRVAVRLIPRIEQTTTHIPSSGLTDGLAFGIYMLGRGGLLPDHIVNDADNRRYIVSISPGDTVLLSHTSQQEIYFPVDGSVVDFVGYSPFKATGKGRGMLDNHTYPVRVDNQSNPAAIDLLYGTVTGKTKLSNPVALPLTHRLSKMQVKIERKAGGDASILKDMRITINGMPLAAGFSLSRATFDHRNEVGVRETGTIAAHMLAEGAHYQAIIIPHLGADYPGRSITFSSPNMGESQSWDITGDSDFLTGKDYTFIFILDSSGLRFAGVTISDWENISITPTAIEMVTIPSGTFLMGSPDTDPDRRVDEEQRLITVSGFRISRYPVTNAQYAAFLSTVGVPASGLYEGNRLIAVPHPYLAHTVTGSSPGWHVADGYENHPVAGVSWYGANAFARWQGGSLPSEAQWEYACRAGTLTPYYIRLEDTLLSRYAWYEANNNNAPGNGIGTKQVGQKYYNPYHLCDMMGNVWEWCLDWYGDYTASPGTDPVYTDPSSGKRVLRGGGFDSTAADCRSAARYALKPDATVGNLGFRVVF